MAGGKRASASVVEPEEPDRVREVRSPISESRRWRRRHFVASTFWHLASEPHSVRTLRRSGEIDDADEGTQRPYTGAAESIVSA